MKNLTLTLFVALTWFALPAFGQAADKFEGWEVRETLNEYDTAWNRKDIKAVGEILDDNYVYFSSEGTLTNKKSSLDFLAKPDYKLTFVKRSEHKLHAYNGKIAVISSRWQGKGSWSGGEINDDQRCGQVFVKSGKTWKLVSENCVQIVAK
ncbi:MAG TPA: nuclear transport factor 2 family protein [Terriglobia bacterium]|jgi:ketosteroid isomerase-like protein|nr:nuclear transport factor 2 family protein [Terriglobia bacterium]